MGDIALLVLLLLRRWWKVLLLCVYGLCWGLSYAGGMALASAVTRWVWGPGVGWVKGSLATASNLGWNVYRAVRKLGCCCCCCWHNEPCP